MRLSLRSVRLQRFKAAFKPDPIELDDLTLLIGRNGSGKSTVLEALQWIDTTLRRDAREASDRYRGMVDLVNLRSRADPPYFAIELSWNDEDECNAARYRLKVEAESDGGPVITEERLWRPSPASNEPPEMINTTDDGRQIVEGSVAVNQPDRLALGLLASVKTGRADPLAQALNEWWRLAVFLRLSPSRLGEGTPAARRSHEPLLDEEGERLAALLYELDDEQRRHLATTIGHILHGIEGVEVSTEGSERQQRANYSLLERMPYQGRSGRTRFPIPAWMLSEGTRRVTAMLALLVHEPPPSLLCIEEAENGLDPWTGIAVLNLLRDATLNTTQIVLTTHSPWLLDHVPLENVRLVERIEGNTQYSRFGTIEDVNAFVAELPPGTRYLNQI